MDALKRFTAGMLRGARWLLLALASGAVWLADLLEDAAERLRP